MILSLLVGCLPPTTFGVRTDGSFQAPGTVELSAGGGLGVPPDDAEAIEGLGVQGAYAVTPGLALTAAAAWLPDDVFGVELGARTRLVGAEQGFSLSSVEGLSFSGVVDGEPVFGAQGGLVGSWGLDSPLRPYLGLVLNPVLNTDEFLDDNLYIYTNLGLGASLSAPATERMGLRCTAELDWNRDWNDGYDTLGGMVLAGVTFR